jgi:CRISPR-associated autoregulator DevR family
MTHSIQTQVAPSTLYELSINIRVAWQAHSISNAGNNGSNRLLPRRQLLADGTETDACSGNILKHHHASLLTQYCEANDIPLCPACRMRDARRAAALLDHPEYQELSIERVLRECALCDTHGFLVTAKHAEAGAGTEARQRLNKHSLIDFSYALALPGRSQETLQLATRGGASKDEGQMLMKMSSRSGVYALCIRYRGVGVGVDTERWRLVITDEQERRLRHQSILKALRDSLLSPGGALTATMLPHFTGMMGALVVTTETRRAPVYSAIDSAFIAQLQSLADDTCLVYPFETITEFSDQLNRLISGSVPALPPSYKKQRQGERGEER